MNKFAISLTMRGPSFTPAFSEEITGDDLLEVISKFILVIARLHQKILDAQYKRNVKDDDIPF